jgi:hypothetical protein
MRIAWCTNMPLRIFYTQLLDEAFKFNTLFDVCAAFGANSQFNRGSFVLVGHRSQHTCGMHVHVL